MDLRDRKLEEQPKELGFSKPGSCQSPYTRLIDVAWGEMDSLGHVNNIYYLRWIETVRFEYFREVGIAAYLEQDKIGPILGGMSMVYKLPITFPDRLEVSTRVVELGSKRFEMENRIWSRTHNRLAGYGRSTIVMVDYNKAGAAVEIPIAVRAAIERLEASHPSAGQEPDQ